MRSLHWWAGPLRWWVACGHWRGVRRVIAVDERGVVTQWVYECLECGATE